MATFNEVALIEKIEGKSAYADADGDTMLVVEYTGSAASCLLSVAANGDITTKIGAAGAEVADTTFGTVDVSTAAYDTFGEVVDYIDALADYRAYLVGALRSDSTDPNSGTGALLTVTDKQAKVNGGYALKNDQSETGYITLAVTNKTFTKTDVAKANKVYRLTGQATFGSGAETVEVHECDDVAKTSTKIWGRAAAATATEFDYVFDHYPISASVGTRLVARVVCDKNVPTAGHFALIGATI